jgi:hypothetical protein
LEDANGSRPRAGRDGEQKFFFPKTFERNTASC